MRKPTGLGPFEGKPGPPRAVMRARTANPVGTRRQPRSLIRRFDHRDVATARLPVQAALEPGYLTPSEFRAKHLETPRQMGAALLPNATAAVEALHVSACNSANEIDDWPTVSRRLLLSEQPRPSVR